MHRKLVPITKRVHFPSTDELKSLKAQTGFNATQLQRLFRRFHHLDKEGKGFLTKDDLMHVHEVNEVPNLFGKINHGIETRYSLQIVLNPIGERIVDMFFQQRNAASRYEKY